MNGGAPRVRCPKCSVDLERRSPNNTAGRPATTRGYFWGCENVCGFTMTVAEFDRTVRAIRREWHRQNGTLYDGL